MAAAAVENLPILNTSAYKFIQLDNVIQRREAVLSPEEVRQTNTCLDSGARTATANLP